MARPRLVFMGTPDFAVPSLLACLELGEVLAVVTQPDKPKGRGQELTASPVKQVALERGLEVLQPPRLKGTPFGTELAARGVDAAVVAAYGKLLPPDVLRAPRLGCVNVHASLLPRFRGAAPIQWAIASGDARTGVTLMQMEEGLDTGPMLAQAAVEIAPDETSATLHDKLAPLGARLLREKLPAFLDGQLTGTPQPQEGVVLAPIIRKEDGRLDFARPAVELERRIRAFSPWPGAFTELAGGLLKVHAARPAGGRGQPGEVLAARGEGLEVACGEGSLVLLEVQPEGKRRMRAAEFLAGRRIAPGERPFGTAERK